MEITVRQKGVPQIIAALNRANMRLKPEIMKIMADEMQGAVMDSKAETQGRGWKLSEETKIMKIDEDNLSVQGGCYASYAGFPEFGTVKQAANPFWMPFVWTHFFEMRRKLYDLQRRMLIL